MVDENSRVDEVDQFILEIIDTVPHLEALLLIWNQRPKTWSVKEIAASLYVPEDWAEQVLQDLTQKHLLRQASASPEYTYNSSEDRDRLIASVDQTYRRELIRISRMIHSKAPSSLREFARSFRFTKEGEQK